MQMFFDLREIPGLKKKPSTSELIDWLKLLMADEMPQDKSFLPLYSNVIFPGIFFSGIIFLRILFSI